MIKMINFSDFCDEFQKKGRGEQFSYGAKRALFDYLEEYENETDEKIELDIIALCCEYSEYADIEAVKENYDNIKDIEDLQDNTQVIEFNGGIIVAQF